MSHDLLTAEATPDGLPPEGTRHRSGVLCAGIASGTAEDPNAYDHELSARAPVLVGGTEVVLQGLVMNESRDGELATVIQDSRTARRTLSTACG